MQSKFHSIFKVMVTVQGLTMGSFFSGIGGFELAARSCGVSTSFCCEIDHYKQGILRRHFPDAVIFGDIQDQSFKDYYGKIDIVAGGFPCQDISPANFNGEGITGSRSGMWGHYARAIGEIRPRACIIENSPLLLKRGFERVLFDLSQIGYNAEWECISASAFGYPHERERLFIVAYPDGVRQPGSGNLFKNVRYNAESRDWQANRVINAIQRKALPPLCDANNGFPERVVKDRITKMGNAALQALGDAVVPAIPAAVIQVLINEILS